MSKKCDLKIMFGKYNGILSFAEVLEQDPSYCSWALGKYRSDVNSGKVLKEAFKALGEFLEANQSSLGGSVKEETPPQPEEEKPPPPPKPKKSVKK